MYASYKASDYVEEKQNQLESWINSFCDTDGAINTGSENVNINGKPAARAAVTLPPPPPPGAIPEIPQGEPSWGDIATDLLESAAEKAVPLAKAWGNAVITLTESNAGFMDRVSAGASLLFPAGPVLMEFATMVGGRGEIKKDVDFPEAGEDTALCDKENKPPRIAQGSSNVFINNQPAARKGEVKDVKVRGGLVIRPRIEVVEADPEQESFSYYSWHIGDYERKLQKNGLVKFMPVMLRSLPYLYRDKHIRCDVAFVPVSKPDENGYCGLGISNYAWRTIFESARTVIFEINEHYPKLQGVDGSHRVHLSEADYIVEGEHEPLPVRSYRAPSETDIAIAKIVVNEIPDGAVLSLGVGGVPYTVAKMLAESDKKDLGCHTGTISDAFLELYQAGKLTNAHKELDTGLSAWNLAMGSQELYDWLDAEPQLFHPGDLDYIHSVERISKFSNVISINGGVQLDLMGQENAESTGTRQLSGVGGQMDFLEGAYRSKGGKGFICINSSRVTKDGERKSNIVAAIPSGSTVSAPRTMIQHVATECGIAVLSGKSLRERAEAMAAIAHPDFREKLMKYARENFR